ncbi:cell division protein FtsL [Pararhodobacter oceanensis]|uniref:cell division protein FtsL n=1 Tax=Pararhodobacter oceanensis TaxID=2172121 RepID=UPI003A944A27
MFYVLSAFAVMGLAIWAYGQNDRTQRAKNETRELRREIRSLTEAINVQRAEWAYLNRPERLLALAEMNASRLGLLSLEGRQFGHISEIPYPISLTRRGDD